MNFYTTLDTGFIEYAERDCLRLVDGSVWSYATLQDYVARLGTVLCERGVEPGDRVVVQVQKSAANLALYLATLRVGAVYVPLNTAYTPQELDYFVEDAGPALFVGHSERQDVPSLTLDEQGNGSLHDAVQACQLHAAIAPRQADDLAAIAILDRNLLALHTVLGRVAQGDRGVACTPQARQTRGIYLHGWQQIEQRQ